MVCGVSRCIWRASQDWSNQERSSQATFFPDFFWQVLFGRFCLTYLKLYLNLLSFPNFKSSSYLRLASKSRLSWQLKLPSYLRSSTYFRRPHTWGRIHIWGCLFVSFYCSATFLIPSWLCFQLFRSADEIGQDGTRQQDRNSDNNANSVQLSWG